jgi:hypothetical protein
MGLKPTVRQLRLRAFYGIRGLALHRLNHAAVHIGRGQVWPHVVFLYEGGDLLPAVV